MSEGKSLFLRLNSDVSELPPSPYASPLRKIDGAVLQKGADGGERVWYQGPEPYFDLFFDLDPQDDSLRWFQFTYRGHAATWDRETGRVELGLTGELEPEELGAPAVHVIQPGGDPAFLDVVLSVLASRPDDRLFAAAHRALTQDRLT